MYKYPLKLEGKNVLLERWMKEFILSTDNYLLENRVRLNELNIPVSVIWGDKDTVTPPWQGEAVAKLFPNSSYVLIKGVGHIPVFENESAFLKAFFTN